VLKEEDISITMILQCNDSPKNQKTQVLMLQSEHLFPPWSRQLLALECASSEMPKETFGVSIFNRHL
jgi:hypothetical protein